MTTLLDMNRTDAGSDLNTEDLVCNMGALAPEQRKAHQQTIAQLFGELLLAKEDLPDGYAYQFERTHYRLVAEFVANEQLCCPFLIFTLRVSPRSDTLRLEITGGAIVKPFLDAELDPQ